MDPSGNSIHADLFLFFLGVRKLLLVIPPSRMATCVFDFIDFMLSMDYPNNTLNLVRKRILDEKKKISQ
jgi:hypothetical protein